jgi:hypothetical protein
MRGITELDNRSQGIGPPIRIGDYPIQDTRFPRTLPVSRPPALPQSPQLLAAALSTRRA